MRPRALAAATLALPALLAPGGCAPLTISATLFADDARLREVEVERDPSADGKIALIDVRGLIADRAPSPLLGPAYNPIDELTARLRRAADDRDVRAVIIRINSPGGTVTGSDMVYREVRRFAETTGKPVVTSLGEVAASGGYYLALAGDRIIAEPTSITGSIGVLIPTINLSEGMERIGIRSRTLVSGENKDVANPLEPPREQHYALLQGLVNEYHRAFRDLVIERRAEDAGRSPAMVPLDASRADQLTDGRIFTGRQALEAGLVDRVGGIHEAFGIAKELVGLRPPRGARLVKYYRQDTDTPRSPYAPTAAPTTPPGTTEINLFQIRGAPLGLGGLESAGAYYLWVPPGAIP